jgi:hypothetical protein
MIINNQYFPFSGRVDGSYNFQELWNEASGQKDSRRDIKGTILLRTIVINEVILKLNKKEFQMLRIFPALIQSLLLQDSESYTCMCNQRQDQTPSPFFTIFGKKKTLLILPATLQSKYLNEKVSLMNAG